VGPGRAHKGVIAMSKIEEVKQANNSIAQQETLVKFEEFAKGYDEITQRLEKIWARVNNAASEEDVKELLKHYNELVAQYNTIDKSLLSYVQTVNDMQDSLDDMLLSSQQRFILIDAIADKISELSDKIEEQNRQIRTLKIIALASLVLSALSLIVGVL